MAVGPFTKLPPIRTGDVNDLRIFHRWLEQVYKILSGTPGIEWEVVSKAGSNIADIETREHNDLQFQRTSVTEAYSINYLDTSVLCDASGGAFQVDLPAVEDGVGPINVKKTDSTSNYVTVAAQSGETLDGAASFDLELQHESITCESDGTEWWIV